MKVDCPSGVQGKGRMLLFLLACLQFKAVVGCLVFGVWCFCLRVEDGLKQMVACHVDKRNGMWPHLDCHMACYLS